MSKFKKRFVVIPLLTLAAAGVIFGVMAIQNSKKSVKVGPVSAAANEASMYGDEAQGDTYYGKLVKGSVANIKTNNELKIENVNVKKGDSVKKGQVLISYDIHSLEDSIADAELQVKTLTNEITIAQNEIDILTRLQPSENAPLDDEEEEDEQATADAPTAPTYEKRITEKSIPLGGSGSADDPLLYLAGADSVLTKGFLSQLSKASGAAVVYVCDDEGNQLYAWLIDGSLIDAGSAADFPVNDGVMITPDGMIAFSGSSVDFATFVTTGAQQNGAGAMEGYIPEEIPELPQLPDTDVSSYELSLNDNYMYSLQQLKDMISEREKQIASLELQKKQAELDIKKTKKLAETGGEISPIDGSVTFVAKDIYHLPESGAYITVANSSGMSVSSSVGEFSRDKVKEGMTAEITNFETGAVTTGTVVELSQDPAEQGSFEDLQGGGMESQYKFTVSLNEDMEIEEDSEVQIKFAREENKDSFPVPIPLVRSEAGRYYMMIANDDNVLEKRYVTVGEVTYGSMEILDGITKEDRFAFPYGKAVEGAPVIDASFEEAYYDFGLFY